MNREKRFHLSELETKINELQNCTNDTEELQLLQKEYEVIHSKEIEGARIRSRVKWWEEGEKSSRFFHSLEKRNGKDKVWDKILDRDGNYIFGTDKVQKTQVEFYKALYKSQELKNGDKEYFLNNVDRKLTESSKLFLETAIAKDEISKAVKKMPNNKSPGADGIPVEFYKV